VRTWQRAMVETRCGGNHDAITMIPAGAPMLVFQVGEMSRAMYRCASCAGEPVPDLSVKQVRRAEPVPNSFTSMRNVFAATVLPFDSKSRQVGSE
jgi:hypothetical protein